MPAGPANDISADRPETRTVGEADLGVRALRTKEAILDASRQLFLERGYAGTRINNITDACGISRAGFYTYFKDKRAVVNELGKTAYVEMLALASAWDNMPAVLGLEDIVDWVRRYFAYMDTHGAFIFSASQSSPDDEDFRAEARRLQMRIAFLIGVAIRSRQASRTSAPEALGLAVFALLDRSWFFLQVQQLPVAAEDIVMSCARLVLGVVND